MYLHSSAGAYGADLQLLAMVRGVDHGGMNPVIVLPERGTLARPLEQTGAEVIVRPLAILRRGLMNPRGLASIAGRMVADRQALTVIAQERAVGLAHLNTSVIVSPPHGVPRVTHVREIYEGVRGFGPWRKRIEGSAEIVCVSDAVQTQFDRGVVVHDGLARTPEPVARAQAREELRLPPEGFVVALLGRISAWKGQDVLARALEHAPGVTAIVAGDSWPGEESAEEELRALAAPLGERFRLLGFRDDVDVVLGAADAVAVPSTRPDPFPNSALEAAFAGLPVVAAAHGGLPEIVRDGHTGLLVPPGDARALAAALQSLTSDPARTRAMGEEARASASGRFGPERMCAQIAAIHGRVMR